MENTNLEYKWLSSYYISKVWPLICLSHLIFFHSLPHNLKYSLNFLINAVLLNVISCTFFLQIKYTLWEYRYFILYFPKLLMQSWAWLYLQLTIVRCLKGSPELREIQIMSSTVPGRALIIFTSIFRFGPYMHPSNRKWWWHESMVLSRTWID